MPGGLDGSLADIIRLVERQQASEFIEKQIRLLQRAKQQQLPHRQRRKRRTASQHSASEGENADGLEESPRHMPTPTEIFNSVTAKMAAEARPRIVSGPVPSLVTLEEVIAGKLETEERKYLKPDVIQIKETILETRPIIHPKPKAAENLFLKEVIPKTMKETTERKGFQRSFGRSGQAVDLPALGIVMQSSPLEEDFTFVHGSKPHKQAKEPRKNVAVPLNHESVMDTLPKDVLDNEPYLKYLRDVASDLGTEQHRAASPVASLGRPATPATPTPGSPSHTAERALLRAAGVRARPATAHTESAALSLSTTGGSPKKTPSRAQSAPAHKGGVLLGVQDKRAALLDLVDKQGQHQAQLRVLQARQVEMQELQQQIEELQREQGPVDPGAQIDSMELKEQLYELERQQKRIGALHQEIMQAQLGQVERLKEGRRKQALEVQAQAQRDLLARMHEHHQAEAMSLYRRQQRFQRSNALLWNKNQYERKRAVEVSQRHKPSTELPQLA
eukprot:TRINITY_DN80491_c0_g1_i1.p1 TRINITY_DN80491_c0_g1~~TRINITY_DN80491_c0_g1_i1.p1  ORF type:complete len:504 (-),score=89.19 TRINITY_DN80491_c0_g1_i1:10-1521(-)